ncbi:MAG: DUF4198 domain-containing protein [Wenzhouxiangellaceae bacterium]|nr:DUF4198 domain-containing protein [Wenzhouxiangellaceae bacterium]
MSVRDAGPGRRHDADLPAAARALGHRLEILPQIDPLGLDAGDTLPVEVRFEGNPFAVALMVFHADSGEEPYLIVETDAGGRADVVLDGPAPWMLSARAEWSYPNPAVCDIPAFNASMTFPQRPSR